MSPVELIALSLGASIAVAALAGLMAASLERLCADPALRERVWAVALYLPVLPPLVIGGVLLTPAPVRVMPVTPLPHEVIFSGPVDPVVVDPVALAFAPDWGLIAGIALGLALVLSVARLASLVRRAVRLHRLVAGAMEVPAETVAAVARAAGEIGVTAPLIRTSAHSPDALLTGLVRPRLILLAPLAGAPDSPAANAVIRHELAHLKRGDHRAVWMEEGLLALLAFNLVLPLIRGHRAAAREEACDALALAGADAPARRAYAQSLIEALRARTTSMLAVPALTFTGSPGSQAMRRLKSILTPPARAGRGMRIAALGFGIAVLSLASAGSMALAGQREATQVTYSHDVSADAAQATARDADAAAQSAARAAARAEMASLPADVQARFRNPTAAQFRAICGSGKEMDEAFCDGVLFGNLPDSDGPAGVICPPVRADGKYDIPAVARLGREGVKTLPVQPDETINSLAKAALQAVFPCSMEGLRALQPTGEQVAVRASARTMRTGSRPVSSDAEGQSAPVRSMPAVEAYSVEAEITEDGVTYADRATASGQARLALADGRYRLTVERTVVANDRRQSDIRIYRRETDGRETLIGAPAMVSARDGMAQYRVGTEGGFMIDVTVGPPA